MYTICNTDSFINDSQMPILCLIINIVVFNEF